MSGTAKKSAKPKKDDYNPAAIIIGKEHIRPDDAAKLLASEDREEAHKELDRVLSARISSQPETRAASVIQRFEGNLDVNALAAEMREQSAEVRKGNMGRAESMLTSQAHTLDTLFANLARRAQGNIEAGYLQAAETYLRLALRAQNQSRMTLESLSAIKNPPVVFAKQMNVAHGPQQVNNGVVSRPEPMAKDVTHTLKNETTPNELSGEPHELLPDTRASQATRRINQEVEAVGEIHRAENR